MSKQDDLKSACRKIISKIQKECENLNYPNEFEINMFITLNNAYMDLLEPLHMELKELQDKEQDEVNDNNLVEGEKDE